MSYGVQLIGVALTEGVEAESFEDAAAEAEQSVDPGEFEVTKRIVTDERTGERRVFYE